MIAEGDFPIGVVCKTFIPADPEPGASHLQRTA